MLKRIITTKNTYLAVVMKILILFLILILPYFALAQKYADKDFYLIDSLILEGLSDYNRSLIDSCLYVFHKEKSDTSKLVLIDYMIEECWDEEVWPKYNVWLYKNTKKKLEGSKNTSFYKKIYAGTLNNFGYIYDDQGKLDLALEYYHEALKIMEEIGNKPGVSNIYNNIAYVYKSQDQLDLALAYYLKSLKIREELDSQPAIASSLNNIGSIYHVQGKIELALDYCHKSLEIRKSLGSKLGVAISLSNLGSVYMSKDQVNKALECFHQSLELKKELGGKSGLVVSYNNVGNAYLQKGNLPKSYEYAKKSLEIAQELGYPNKIELATKTLYQVAQRKGNYKEAYEMYQLYIKMRDSMNNEHMFRASVQQNSKYEYEKQKLEDSIVNAGEAKVYLANIAVEEAKNEKQKTELKAQEKQKIVLYIGLGLVALFGGFMFNRFRITKKQKNIIEGQKKEVEKSHKEITDSINYTERIQRSFLAMEEMLNRNLREYFVFFQPKDVVSGDFYWADELSNGNFAMVNADSTGHGVPGAIMSILNISSIENAVKEGLTHPADIFNSTRKTIIERLKKDGSEHGGKDGMDASIICFDFKKMKMTYTAAQNPIWVIRFGEITVLEPEKMPVGKHDHDHIPFVGGEFNLQKGDQVYTITDGFQDQFGGEKGKKFMVKKMREYVVSISHLPMPVQHEKLKEVFSNWKGDLEQVDDVCIIGVKI